MLDPVVDRILRAVGTRPTRIVIGSALLALLVHLDGSGAVTFLVTVPAMLPLYDRLGMDRRILACVASMAAGVNFLPWTGPTLRAVGGAARPDDRLFRPLVPVQLVGLVFVFRRRRRARPPRGAAAQRLAHGRRCGRAGAPRRAAEDASALRRPRLLLDQRAAHDRDHGVMMIGGTVDPAVMFMLGTALALIDQLSRLRRSSARASTRTRERR